MNPTDQPGYFMEPVYRKTLKCPHGWPPKFEPSPLPPRRQVPPKNPGWTGTDGNAPKEFNK